MHQPKIQACVQAQNKENVVWRFYNWIHYKKKHCDDEGMT